MIDVQKSGTLIDIIRAGSNAQIPQITWINGGCSYQIEDQDPSIEMGVYIALEEARIAPLDDADVKLLLENRKFLVHTTETEKDSDVWVRVANVFVTRTPLESNDDRLVSQTPLHWQVGMNVLSPTLFMSQYGPGTRVFMSV